jgi:hypothetical protein
MTEPGQTEGTADAIESPLFEASVSDRMLVGLEGGLSSETLWKILTRHDYYASTTTSRAPLIMTFNVFVVSAIFVNWQDLLDQFKPHRNLVVTAGVLLTITALAALASLEAMLRVVARPRVSGKPRLKSVVFFQHVADSTLQEFRARVAQSTDTAFHTDLSEQAYGVARSVAEKFRALRRSIDYIRFGQLIPIAILLLVKLALTLGMFG